MQRDESLQAQEQRELARYEAKRKGQLGMFDTPKAPEYGLMDAPVRQFKPGAEEWAACTLVCARMDGDATFAIRGPEGGSAALEQRLVKHSPTGMEWGYGGSGPADLALNILALFVDPREASRLHQDFKWAAVSRWDRDHVEIPLDRVRQWLADTWATERLDRGKMEREEEARRDARAIEEAEASDRRALDENGGEVFILSDDFSRDDGDPGVPDEPRESYAAGDHTHGRADA